MYIGSTVELWSRAQMDGADDNEAFLVSMKYRLELKITSENVLCCSYQTVGKLF